LAVRFSTGWLILLTGMSRLAFDEDEARQIEALYRIDAARRRGLVREALGAQPGERILDVGCGPGFYCAELLDEVGTAGWSNTGDRHLPPL
jgi:arsenite methyltransferase